MTISKTSSTTLQTENSEHFIPFACHYDSTSLLTKNGELLQTIEIKGLSAKNINKNLSNLRKSIQDSIIRNITNKDFSFWVHTIREKTKLDDSDSYTELVSTNLHAMWLQKNKWDSAFTNNLYITIIHRAPELHIADLNSLVNSFSRKTLSGFEESFFQQSLQVLNQKVDLILQDLNEYKPKRLGIKIEEESCYSEPISLFSRIIQLNKTEHLAPTSDISLFLGSSQYIMGNNQTEIITPDSKKFSAILSVKEYKQIPEKVLDVFLQTPAEMVITEIFYFVDRESVIPKFKEQNDILKISNDTELRKLKNLDTIIDNNDNLFTHQQISIMVIEDELYKLDSKVNLVSNNLSKLGIMHVREDIDLEKVFWAQLPTNFGFLSRLSVNSFENVYAFSSLHNTEIGNQYNPWGNALTLLKTENNTPYFMSLHDQNNMGTNCIFGDHDSGKTTIMNFLLSESQKYNPITIYLTNNEDSKLYIKARAGNWIQERTNIINPLLCEETEENKEFIFNFFKIISGHYFNPLGKDELSVFKVISNTIFKLPYPERKLSFVIQTLKELAKNSEELDKRLSQFLPDGKYYGIFESDKAIELSHGDILGINLADFSNSENFKDPEKKILESVKAGLLFSLQNLLTNTKDSSKILAVDNLLEILNLSDYQDLFAIISTNISNNQGVFLSNIQIDKIQKLYLSGVSLEWIKSINTTIVLPSELSQSTLGKILNLTKEDLANLVKFKLISRKFLIKQDGKAIIVELSLDEFPAWLRFLSAKEEEFNIYSKILENNPNIPLEDWVPKLYQELDNAHD